MEFRYVKTDPSFLEENIPEQFYDLDLDWIELHEVKENWDKIANAKRKDFVVYQKVSEEEVILFLGFYSKNWTNFSRKSRPTEEEKQMRTDFFGEKSFVTLEEYNQIIGSI